MIKRIKELFWYRYLKRQALSQILENQQTILYFLQYDKSTTERVRNRAKCCLMSTHSLIKNLQKEDKK